MGVKKKKIRGKWYIVVNYRGQRKTKCVGSSEQVADIIRAKVELQLAEGNLGIFSDEDPAGQDKEPSFTEAGERWLKTVEMSAKRETMVTYEGTWRVHILPFFKNKKLRILGTEDIERFLYSKITQRTGDVQDYSQNSTKLMLAVLRTFLAYAVGKKWLVANPATGMGKLLKTGRAPSEIIFMSKPEAAAFLESVKVVQPEGSDYYELFKTGFYTGMRRGELLGLRLGDVSLGRFPGDPVSCIVVANNNVKGQDGTPKSNKTRRIDLANELRGSLVELRDRRSLRAYQRGLMETADEFAFCDEHGDRITAGHMKMVMNRALDHAGLRRFNRHSIRHSFAAWLIQAGVSPAYVQLQMGHSSIAITIKFYGHLAPGTNSGWINAVSLTQQDANQAQTPTDEEKDNILQVIAGMGDNTHMCAHDHLTKY